MTHFLLTLLWEKPWCPAGLIEVAFQLTFLPPGAPPLPIPTASQLNRARVLLIVLKNFRVHDGWFYVSMWLGHTVLRYVVKHCSECVCEGVYWMRFTFKLVGFE